MGTGKKYICRIGRKQRKCLFHLKRKMVSVSSSTKSVSSTLRLRRHLRVRTAFQADTEEALLSGGVAPGYSQYSLPGWIVLLAPGYALVGLSARLHQGRVRLRREPL